MSRFLIAGIAQQHPIPIQGVQVPFLSFVSGHLKLFKRQTCYKSTIANSCIAQLKATLFTLLLLYEIRIYNDIVHITNTFAGIIMFVLL
ncbi:MAG TPA: hypothetical protein VKB95_07000, partial [Chitinophagaceae bacterium]|nr:hypothetical protein [Chitinophagaceae bacterium]